MAIYTIFWPSEVCDELIQFLRDVHRIPWAEVVSYVDEEIGPADIAGISKFLQEHKDPDQFMYVEGETHVAVVYEDKVQAGWARIDRDGYIRNLFHHLPDRAHSHISCLAEVWHSDPPLRPMADTPSYLM